MSSSSGTGSELFPRSVEMRPPESEYSFYDGPPFPMVARTTATCRGHQGHRPPGTGRCGGTGWSVDSAGTPTGSRWRWRWSALGLSGPKDIADYGIERFNAACRRGAGQHRDLGVAHPTPRPLGRLRRRLQDHGPRVHGERVVGVPPAMGPRAGVSGRQGPPLLVGVRRRRCPTSRRTSITARSTTRGSRCGSR